jgi:hypothetical protein
MRHLLKQPNNNLNKRQACYVRNLQRFLGTMTLAYRKGAISEGDPLSRRLGFVPQATSRLFWDGEVPSNANLRRKSQPLLEDAHLNLTNVNALRLSHEIVDLNRERYSQDSFYGDEGEWTKDNRIEAIVGYVWRLDRRCVPRNSEFRLNYLRIARQSVIWSHMSCWHFCYRARQIQAETKLPRCGFCECCVVCRRAKIQPQIAAAL